MKRKDCSSDAFTLRLEYITADGSESGLAPAYSRDPARFRLVDKPLARCSARLTFGPVPHSVLQEHEDAHANAQDADGQGLEQVCSLIVDTGVAKFMNFPPFPALACLRFEPMAAKTLWEILLACRVQTLTALFLPFCDVNIVQLSLTRLKHGLRFLDLTGNRAPDRDLGLALAEFTNLEGLDLSYTDLGPATAAEIVKLAQGQILRRHVGTSLLDWATDTDSEGKPAGSRGLQGLWITLTATTPVDRLRGCSTLWFLGVRDSAISDEDRLALCSLPSVSYLHLENSRFGRLHGEFSRPPLEVHITNPGAEAVSAEAAAEPGTFVPETQPSQGSFVLTQDSLETVPPTQVPASPPFTPPNSQ
jgi:hypothetical protein